MDKLKELAIALAWLIRIGTGTRITYCFIKMISNDDEVSVYKKRIKNTIGFLILSESVWQLKDIVIYYFG
ncbi:hypothetical protein ACR77J_13915 [Tissierella praeacuta]|uniref:hypothetical protein n=1 Tax=Tissierella praeacuta TaxID=43131 RepID=UPI003DA6709F